MCVDNRPCLHTWKYDQETWKEFCVRCGTWKPAHYQDGVEGQEGIPGYYNEGLNRQHPPVPEPEPDVDHDLDETSAANDSQRDIDDYPTILDWWRNFHE